MESIRREELSLERTPQSSAESCSRRGIHLTKAKLCYLVWVLFILLGIVIAATHFFTKWQLRQDTGESTSEVENFEDVDKPENVRLPGTVSPIYYKLEVIPFLEPGYNFALDGRVYIDVKCVRDTKQITLHLKNLAVEEESVTVTEVANAELPVTNTPEMFLGSKLGITGFSYDGTKSFFTIGVSPPLKKDTIYRIFIEYRGHIGDNVGGFYKTAYANKANNETRYIGITQFQPSDARKAFPCFDEPELKAKFQISIARRRNMSSISNTNLVKSEPILDKDDLKGWVWDHFKKSVPMSTYLVTFMVLDFQNKTADLATPELRIWARNYSIHMTEYAKDIVPRILTFFEDYFEMLFPLSKLDLVAVPDFHFGAMENWGAIVFRESSLIYDKTGSSDEDKLAVARLTSHEISHQWFGNLATPQWWDDLWLNEGFAIYMEYVGANHVNPEIKPLEQFVTSRLHQILRLDGLDSARPISVPVYNPSDMSRVYNCIVNGKSASIIRMLEHVISNSTFKKGLQKFIKKWSHNAPTRNDFWAALTEQAHMDNKLVSNLSVSDITKSWIVQKGYPLVTVTRNYQDGSVTFSQEKFQAFPNPNKTTEYNQCLWWIPINFASRSFNSQFENTEPILWLSTNSFTLTSERNKNISQDNSRYLIVNVQQTGYYRVNYDSKNWRLITQQLWISYSAIHVVNRAQILDDIYGLAQAEHLPYPMALNLTLYLHEESEYLPWHAFSQTVEYMVHMLSRSPIYGQLQEFLQNLVEKQYKRVGFVESSPETELMRLLRTVLVKLACMVELKDCVDRAVQEFAGWMRKADPDKVNTISPNLRASVYCTAIQQGSKKEWDFLWERYRKCHSVSHKKVMLAALGCSKDPWILNKLLNLTITEGSGIKIQDAPSVFTTLLGHDIGSTIAFYFLRDKWLDIGNYFKQSSYGHGILSVIRSIPIKFNTPVELAALEHFMTQYKNELGTAAKSLNQTIQNIGTNIRWLGNNYQTIASWLELTLKEQNESDR